MKHLVTILASLLIPSSLALSKTLLVPADFRTIQEAIDAADAGDRILVTAGIYRERLSMKSHVSLISEGDDMPGKRGLARAERTVIDGEGAGQMPGVTMAEDATIDGFTVTGVGAFDESLWRRHWEERGENQTHASIGGFGVPAIAVDGVGCRIQNCVVRENGHTGIAVRGRPGRVDYPLVLDNHCFRNMGAGIGLMEGAGGIVQGNECAENFWAGIGHSGAASPLVVANDCHDNVRAGIGISDGASPIVRGNRCHANRRAGIGIRTGSGTRPIVEDNECMDNGLAGIGVNEGAEPILRGNRCERNRLAGIGADQGAKPLIIANRCLENGAAGVGLGADCEAVLWRNTCEANRTVAIGLPRNGRAIIANNQLSREGGMPPLIAIRGGSEAVLTGNELKGGGVAGVLIDGRAILARNTIVGSHEDRGQGIWLWKGSSAIGVSNVVTGFKAAQSIADGAEWVGDGN